MFEKWALGWYRVREQRLVEKENRDRIRAQTMCSLAVLCKDFEI